MIDNKARTDPGEALPSLCLSSHRSHVSIARVSRAPIDSGVKYDKETC